MPDQVLRVPSCQLEEAVLQEVLCRGPLICTVLHALRHCIAKFLHMSRHAAVQGVYRAGSYPRLANTEALRDPSFSSTHAWTAMHISRVRLAHEQVCPQT